MKTTNHIRVMCVDDNELLAVAIERRMSSEPDFEWVGWLSEIDNVTPQVMKTTPDVVLLDIDMPGRNVFELVVELTETVPQARVVMFSGYVRTDYIDRAVECGAWGYASKNDNMDEVLIAIRRVAAGEFVLTPEVLAEQTRRMRLPPQPEVVEVLDQLADRGV
jgi:two-component system response regulator DesR